MRTYLTGGLILTMLFGAMTHASFAQQSFKTTAASVIPYLEYLPDSYAGNSNKYPLVIFLHGNGEKGPNTTDVTVLEDYIQNVARHGPPRHVNAGTKFPFILISPQLKNNFSTWPSSYVLEVINHCRTYLRVDERRIVITGLSLGGGGAWVAAQDYPELFAAMAPVCGGYNSPSKACAIANEDLPVWAFHGDIDTVVPLSRTTSMVNAINSCVPAPQPAAKLTVYEGVAHNAWDYAYRPDQSLHDPNVYDWMMSFVNTHNNGNMIPVANAGSDRTTTSRSLTLTAAGSDSDGSISGYAWKKISGPAAVITGASTSAVSLSDLEIGIYELSVTVTDNSGNSDTDYVRVTVRNAAPVANAGPDRSITLPVSSLTLIGSGTDADGSVTSFFWSRVSGPVATISNSSSASAVVSGLTTAGTYVFRLRVTDNLGATDNDDVTVTVVAPAPPTVSAGADKLVRLPTNAATIQATAQDADGSIVSYEWFKLSGGVCTMSSITTPTLKLGGLQSGSYVFRLTVTDNAGLSASDDVRVDVDAPPVVNAGSDKLVFLPLEAPVVLTANATDSDGLITKYQWSKYSGPNVIVSNSTTASLTISQVYEGVYVFKIAVTDNLGVVGFDYVTVTVEDPAITATGSTGGSMVVEQVVAIPEMKRPAIITLFNERGEQIYSGEWSLEKEREIMKQNGLYIYRILGDDNRIRCGKVYIKGI